MGALDPRGCKDVAAWNSALVGKSVRDGKGKLLLQPNEKGLCNGVAQLLWIMSFKIGCKDLLAFRSDFAPRLVMVQAITNTIYHGDLTKGCCKVAPLRSFATACTSLLCLVHMQWLRPGIFHHARLVELRAEFKHLLTKIVLKFCLRHTKSFVIR